jgi:hypothetical protein
MRVKKQIETQLEFGVVFVCIKIKNKSNFIRTIYNFKEYWFHFLDNKRRKYLKTTAIDQFVIDAYDVRLFFFLL